jgi:Ig-like domain-containing protein
VVYRIDADSSAPAITTHPASQTVAPGASVSFNVAASGPPPLRYQWQRNGVDIPGATTSTYTLASAAAGDNAARFRVIVSNDSGNALSNEAVLTVTANRPPTASITQPAAGTMYGGGDLITYAGTGTDSEDGTLPASAFTWRVDFHHDTRVVGRRLGTPRCDDAIDEYDLHRRIRCGERRHGHRPVRHLLRQLELDLLRGDCTGAVTDDRP